MRVPCRLASHSSVSPSKDPLRRPQCIVIAGPNGAGKSTYSRDSFKSGFLVLDPDRFGISASSQAPVLGGRSVINRVRKALHAREEFVIETTLSGRFPMKTLLAAGVAGYEITLIYIGVEDPDECVRRVAKRVEGGGHDVPEADIRRRYVRSLRALPAAVAYADRVMILSNPSDSPYEVVAIGEFPGRPAISSAIPRWATAAVSAVMRRAEAG
jgi:predicted ABC-type ATPase